jgi:predicted RNase H-like HicB family nuclease
VVTAVNRESLTILNVRLRTVTHKPFTMEAEGTLVPAQFDVVIERDEEGYYVASVPSIPGCHTQARSLDEVTQRIREAIELCLEVEGAPEHSLEFVGIQRVTVAA